MLFKKKKPSGMTVEMLKKMDKTSLRLVNSRDSETARETRLGTSGAVNIIDGSFTLVCSGKTVFSAPLGSVAVGELMNLSGFTASYTDENGVKQSVIAYYSDGCVSFRK